MEKLIYPDNGCVTYKYDHLSRLTDILAELHLNKKDLETDEAVIKVMRKFAEINGGKKAVHLYRKSKISFLGITGVDCFWHDNNFVFGVARNREYGVMSYRRFTADFNGEPPNSDRLFQRILKQAISTTGLMYGLPRCTSPICVRAYPNNLAEHDAKSAVLCQTCKEGFQKIFHAKKKEPNTF